MAFMISVPWPGFKPRPWQWKPLDHWTTREFPWLLFLDKHFIFVPCTRAVKSEVTKRGSKSLSGGNSQSMLPIHSSRTFLLKVRREPWFHLKPAFFLESQRPAYSETVAFWASGSKSLCFIKNGKQMKISKGEGGRKKRPKQVRKKEGGVRRCPQLSPFKGMLCLPFRHIPKLKGTYISRGLCSPENLDGADPVLLWWSINSCFSGDNDWSLLWH